MVILIAPEQFLHTYPPDCPPAWWNHRREKKRVENSRKRAKRYGRPRALTLEQWYNCLQWWGCSCAYCGVKLTLERGQPNELVLEHYKPLYSQYSPGTTANNVLCACTLCNDDKHHLWPRTWLKKRLPEAGAALIWEEIEQYLRGTRFL